MKRFTRQADARRLVIVGAGSNGTWMSVHAARLPGISEMVLIDRTGRFGRGVAYSAMADCHRLNVPAERMGGSSQADTTGFSSWLASNGWPEAPSYEDTFVPRRLYGDYLCAELDAVQATGRLNLIQDEVLAIEPRPDGQAVIMASGAVIEAGLVVLCIGNPPPAPIRHAEPSSRLVPDIWQAGALDAIEVADDVIIVGTGATAIDAALYLVQHNRAPRIRMISRNGRFPLVDVPTVACEALDPIPTDTALGTMKGLRAMVAERAARGVPWQATFDAFRASATDIWLGLSEDERRRFLRHLRSTWLVHRHRLAPDIARQLSSLQAQGRIEVVPARVVGGEPTPDGYALRVHRRGRPPGALDTLEADWVVNCTGPDENYTRSQVPIVQSLLRSGVARPGPFGLGLDCDVDHRLIDADGCTHAGLFLVGPPTRGRFWEVTSAPSGRDQCERVAKSISATLSALAIDQRLL